MARQDDNKRSGNDGSWFLEAVGALPPSPRPSETVAALEIDNTAPDPDPVLPPHPDDSAPASFDGDTATSTAAFETPSALLTAEMADTSGMDEFASTLSNDPPDDTQLSPVLRTSRPFRWPVLAFVGLLVAITVAAVFGVPAVLRQNAAGTRASYADASLALRLQLPPGQAALDTITDPASTSEELSASVPVISQLDSAAHELAVVAAERLPRQIPGLPVVEVASLEPLSDTAQINAAQGSDIARRMGHTYVYRTTIPQLLITGDLVTSADVQTINSMSVSLASSLVEDATALSDLPTPEFASDLNNATHDAVERYASWQDEYLNALADGDEDVARTLIAELTEIRTELNAMLEVALGVARIDIDLQIVGLAASLESFLEDLTRR